MGRGRVCGSVAGPEAAEEVWAVAGRLRNGRRTRSFSVSGQTPAGPRDAAFRGRLWNGPRACSWRLASVGHDESVGPSQMTFATVWAQRDVHAGAPQDTLGEGLLDGRRRRFSRNRFADGGEDLFTVGRGHPAEVADLVEAVRQDVGQEAAGE